MWSQNSSQLDTEMQLLNVKFHVSEGPQQMLCDIGISQEFRDIKPHHIHPAQRNEHPACPENFMGLLNQLNYYVI